MGGPGPPGPLGEKGARGPIGRKGDVGDEGVKGCKGDEGMKGSMGLPGLNGAPGQGLVRVKSYFSHCSKENVSSLQVQIFSSFNDLNDSVNSSIIGVLGFVMDTQLLYVNTPDGWLAVKV